VSRWRIRGRGRELSARRDAAEAAVTLSVDALSTTDRLVVLNTCLRNALDDAHA
jgi:hypothetical protein